MFLFIGSISFTFLGHHYKLEAFGFLCFSRLFLCILHHILIFGTWLIYWEVWNVSEPVKNFGNTWNANLWWFIRWCQWKIWMGANLLKQENSVRGEMVLCLTFLSLNTIFDGLEIYGLLMFNCVAGRGVDLNRNWSVDWGKKEKVCYAFIYLHF